ncbi:MAG: ATP-dependent nuclease [Bacillota bacterium]
MKISHFRIKSFRTIKREIAVSLKDGTCLVGPNNVGKSNLLRALQMFFTGYENKYGYTRERDLPFGVNNTQTSLICTFSAEQDNQYDEEVLSRYHQLHNMIPIPVPTGRDITIYLTFSSGSNPTYRLFPNTPLPHGTVAADFSRRQKAVVQDVLAKFVLYYVPSNKSFLDLYQSLVLDFIRQEIANDIQPVLSTIRDHLAQISNEVSQALSGINEGHLHIELRPPGPEAKEMLSGFDFHLLDPQDTSVFSKGVGIQSAAMMAFFLWISRRNRGAQRNTVWLLEEPESYLHPSLATGVSGLVRQLSSEAIVLLTTHSLSFVSKTPERNVGLSIEDSSTSAIQFTSYREATTTLRKTLGVEFSDFFNLDLYNLFVEGELDKRYLEWYLDHRLRQGKPGLDILGKPTCTIIEFGGVGFLGGFLKANYQFIRPERPTVSVFDGDQAGVREARGVQQYCGQKNIPFVANRNFVYVRDRFAIEGLFPDAWIIDHHTNLANWYDEFSVDVQGALVSFRVKDSHKLQFYRDMTQKAEAEPTDVWAERFERLVQVLNDSLKSQGQAIYGN